MKYPKFPNQIRKSSRLSGKSIQPYMRATKPIMSPSSTGCVRDKIYSPILRGIADLSQKWGTFFIITMKFAVIEALFFHPLVAVYFADVA